MEGSHSLCSESDSWRREVSRIIKVAAAKDERDKTNYGLLIKQQWIDKILQGLKTWEIRGRRTNIRGDIALIRSGSGCIVGTCKLIDVIGPLTLPDLLNNIDKHCISEELLRKGLPYKNTFAWVMKNVRCIRKPIPYKHPRGAVIWVKLN